TSTSTTGKLTTTGQQTWNSGASYGWKLNLNNANAGGTTTLNSATLYTDTNGTNWDQLSMTSLSLAATSPAQVTLNVIGTNGPTGSGSPFSANQNYQWIAATVPTTGLAGNYVGAFNLNVAGIPAATGTFSAQFVADPANSSQQDFVVSYVAPTPEPTSLALLGVGAAGLLLRRRRRSSARPC
ncbi:MAG TPA: PEP-CTERM sorting domain-containing protein, partial [Tepidisphaeraceae bacterium]|nr:PEP-CTERM sorting domain-containing protein [Tepidisphaeraceae bacterium]